MVLSSRHGLWLRLEAVVTDAELPVDRPMDRDLCGSCTRCVKACPAKALKPYVLDPTKCLIDMSLMKNPPKKYDKLREKFEPQLTRYPCDVHNVPESMSIHNQGEEEQLDLAEQGISAVTRSTPVYDVLTWSTVHLVVGKF